MHIELVHRCRLTNRVRRSDAFRRAILDTVIIQTAITNVSSFVDLISQSTCIAASLN